MYKVIKKNICYIIVSCILFGIVAHGFFMVNNFVFNNYKDYNDCTSKRIMGLCRN